MIRRAASSLTAVAVFAAAFAFAAPSVHAQPGPEPADLVGSWEGSIVTPQGALRIVLEVAFGDDGLSAEMFSPDQTPQAIPVAEVILDGTSFVFTVPAVQGRYEGEIVSGTEVEGTWFQGPASLPLDLKKAEGDGGR